MANMNLMDFIDSASNQASKLILFNKIKTGDPIVDAFLTTIVLGLFSWSVSLIYDNHVDRIFNNFSLDDIKSFLYKKNTLVIEGKSCSSTSPYNSSYIITSAYSNRFKAIWNHIISNIENNTTIFKVKETHTNYQGSNAGDSKSRINDMFMVFQNKHFLLDQDIYIKTVTEQECDGGGEKEKDKSVRIDKITINIYSYRYSMSELIKYVDDITGTYLKSIKSNRLDKKFIYFLDKVELGDEYDTIYDCWREDLFESARTFKNIFFDGKQQLIGKIDFFLNNKDWYFKKGIPYSLGIGLHGPPGTGKTSLIKALANYTDRHIVVFSLKIIKTKQQLEKFFFENTYNPDNEKHSISWDKKIIVFEDIDCIGDIILNRNEKNKNNEKKGRNFFKKTEEKTIDMEDDTVKVGDILQTICGLNDSNTTTSTSKEQPITLDDILNLWDGIRETPGRILIITSNHYDKLDPALVRPGRIDITHELSNASHNTISEIYKHLFEEEIDQEKLKTIKEYHYSPAELINIYVSHKNKDDFLNVLTRSNIN